MIDLLPFQRRFLKQAFSPKYDAAALSIPRGNGKSTLAAHILERCLTIGDPLNEPGAEYLLGAASLEGARFVYRPLREALEGRGRGGHDEGRHDQGGAYASGGAYRFIDSVTRLGIVHKATNTRLRVQSSNAKTAFGIVGTPLAVLDEPGAWETVGGQLMADALFTAQAKPGSSLRLIFIGTLAPADMGWWHELIEGGGVSTYVQALTADREKWDRWPEIRRCNPLMAKYPESRKKLLQERDEARADARLKARFLSYRMNVPSRDESEMLLTVEDFKLATGRPIGIPSGEPIVGIDLGGGRAWSAAVAIWQSGRCEAIALAPGIPDIGEQEKRDRVGGGVYQRLVDRGLLGIADGLMVQPPSQLWEMVLERWGVPFGVVCDRFRLGELVDVIQGACEIEPRITQWSTASADIRALRRIGRDGPLSIPKESELLFAESLRVAYVQNDNSGNVRLVKRGTSNAGRDDVAAALVLAAGAWDRYFAGREDEASDDLYGFVAR